MFKKHAKGVLGKHEMNPLRRFYVESADSCKKSCCFCLSSRRRRCPELFRIPTVLQDRSRLVTNLRVSLLPTSALYQLLTFFFNSQACVIRGQSYSCAKAQRTFYYQWCMGLELLVCRPFLYKLLFCLQKVKNGT